MTRVMVTGARGFVGHHVREQLLRGDFEVGLHDIGMTLNGADCDVVISLAASADPRAALEDPVRAYENNVRATVETMEFARRTGARVLHVSSNEVYGTKARLPYAPVGPYAGGKACQELVCRSYPDVATTIVVTQSLFGECQQRDKLIPTIIRRLLGGDPVTLQQSGGQWAKRPFIHARNLAEALAFLATNPTDAERVHVGSAHPVSVRLVAETLADELGVEAEIEAIEAADRPGHELAVKPIGCDVPGWFPKYGLTHGLRHVARWYREHPGWL